MRLFRLYLVMIPGKVGVFDMMKGDIGLYWLALDPKGVYSSFTNLKERGVIAQGWPRLGNLESYSKLVANDNKLQFYKKLEERCRKKGANSISSTPTQIADIMWNLFNLKVGDIVVAIEGRSVRGLCCMKQNGCESYSYTKDLNYAHGFGKDLEWIEWDESKTPLPRSVHSRAKGIMAVRKARADILRGAEKLLGDKFPDRESKIAERLELDEDLIVREITQSQINETTKKQLVDSRRGQGQFKKSVISVEGLQCRVTNTTDPNFLIASHIKPWKVSSDTERLDGNNGLFLAPHIDKMFDGGWISFSDNGEILFASDIVKEQLSDWSVNVTMKVGPFNKAQRKYLSYHRKNLLEQRMSELL